MEHPVFCLGPDQSLVLPNRYRDPSLGFARLRVRLRYLRMTIVELAKDSCGPQSSPEEIVSTLAIIGRGAFAEFAGLIVGVVREAGRGRVGRRILRERWLCRLRRERRELPVALLPRLAATAGSEW
jgi:hypothetical protein